MRQNATTGAPVRSDPKLGNACAWRPSLERGDRQQLGRGDHALAAAAVDAHLKHLWISLRRLALRGTHHGVNVGPGCIQRASAVTRNDFVRAN